MKEKIPGPVLRRSVLLLLFSILCVLIGISAGCSGDRTFLVLSLVVAGGCLYRAVTDYRAAGKGKLKVVEGICLAASRNFGRFQEVTLEGEDGNSIRLRLQKNVRVTPGESYRFYLPNHFLRS